MKNENMTKIVYEVKYKKRNWLSCWHSLFITEDGIIPQELCQESFRFFTLATGERMEVPMKNTIFRFSSERAKLLSGADKSLEQADESPLHP